MYIPRRYITNYATCAYSLSVSVQRVCARRGSCCSCKLLSPKNILCYNVLHVRIFPMCLGKILLQLLCKADCLLKDYLFCANHFDWIIKQHTQYRTLSSSNKAMHEYNKPCIHDFILLLSKCIVVFVLFVLNHWTGFMDYKTAYQKTS